MGSSSTECNNVRNQEFVGVGFSGRGEEQQWELPGVHATPQAVTHKYLVIRIVRIARAVFEHLVPPWEMGGVITRCAV